MFTNPVAFPMFNVVSFPLNFVRNILCIALSCVPAAFKAFVAFCIRVSSISTRQRASSAGSRVGTKISETTATDNVNRVPN